MAYESCIFKLANVTAKSISRPSGEDVNPRLRLPVIILRSTSP